MMMLMTIIYYDDDDDDDTDEHDNGDNKNYYNYKINGDYYIDKKIYKIYNLVTCCNLIILSLSSSIVQTGQVDNMMINHRISSSIGPSFPLYEMNG